MWAIIARIAKIASRKVVKNAIRPVKFAVRLAKNPVKTIKKAANPVNVIKAVKTKQKQLRRAGRIGKLLFSPKARAIERITEKARIIEHMARDVNELLEKKSNALYNTSETVKEINRSEAYLKNMTTPEIREAEKLLQNEMKALNLENAEAVEKAITEAENYQELVQQKAYETFMENWKNGFFAYEPEELGMTEDEREIIWQENLANRDYNWYVNTKLK